MAILLVEDETYPDYKEYPLVFMLQKEGFKEVHVANTGNEAIRLLCNKNYQAVILDIILQAGDGKYLDPDTPHTRIGIEILKLLRNKENRQTTINFNIPVVVVSGVIEAHDLNEVTKMLGDERLLLSKPVKPEIIVKVLRSIISD